MADEQTDPTLAPTVDSGTPAPDAPPAENAYQAYKASRTAPAPEPEAVAPAPVPVEAAAPPQTETEPEHREPARFDPNAEPQQDDPTKPPYLGESLTPTQKRINKAWAKQKDAERNTELARAEATAARERSARLEVELAQFKTGQAKPVDAPSQTVAQAQDARMAAFADNPADPKPKRDDFDSYEDGNDAVGEWIARQVYRQERAKENDASARVVAQEAHQQRLNSYFARLDEFKKATPDFDALVNNPSANLPVSPAVSSLIVESPVGPALSYYLAQHPDECQAIYALDERSAAKALGRIEAKVEGQQAPAAAGQPPAPAPVVPPKPISQAPAPITPVAGSRVAAPTLNTHNYADYKRARLAGKL